MQRQRRTGLDDINADINSLKTWKANVETGETVVLIETDDEEQSAPTDAIDVEYTERPEPELLETEGS